MRYVLNSNEAVRSCLEHITSVNVGQKPIMTVEIKPFRKDRSNQQNRYYHGVVLKMISDYTGYCADELHETFKSQLLPTKVVQIGSVRKEVSTSTTSLTTTQFEDYCEDIRRFAAETIGLVIPDPNQAGVY